LLLLDGQVHHDTHVIPMGNYVIGVGNYVIVSPSDLGNYVSADTPIKASPMPAHCGRCLRRSSTWTRSPTWTYEDANAWAGILHEYEHAA